MRIGADGSYLRWRRSGLSRYIDGLLHGIESQLADEDELVVYYNSWPGEPLFGGRVRERSPRLKGAGPWNQVAVPLCAHIDRCDVYLGTANIVPVVLGRPRVLLVHDALVFADPSSKPPRIRRYLRRWQPRSARAATRVLATSEWAAMQCERYLGVPREHVAVVGAGVDARFAPVAESEREDDRRRVRRAGIHGRFVLQVGAFEPHKGADVAVAAVERLRGTGLDVDLVRCGRVDIADAGHGVLDVGHVDEDTLVALYREAAAVCVTSTHEGLGFPVIEAMACGTPVVVSRAAALPDTAGGAALIADAGDVAGFAAALERILSDPAEVSRLRALGFDRSATFRWDRVATLVLDVLHEAVGRHPAGAT